jgi:phytoene desaturase
MYSIGIIGSGLSSLYAACVLAKNGHAVQVFEKNSNVGGRCQTFETHGYTFDMGPSWYWMPELIDGLFTELGEKRSDYFELKRLDPSYQVFWEDQSNTMVPSSIEELKELFESFEENGAKKLEAFLQDAETKYKIAVSTFLEKPGLKFSELLDLNAIKNAFKLDVFKSVEKDVYKRFSSEKARSILTFPVLFLGAMPDKIPALYTMMNHADLSLGTWYPEGGMSALPKALMKIAEAHGVTFHFNTNVEHIIEENDKVKGLMVNREPYSFDHIVSGADYHHTEQVLLPKKYRIYDEKYWDSRKLAPSSLIYYLGVNKRIEGLEHHNLFFDEDLTIHGKTIYESKKWPDDPLFYVCAPSKTDNEVAPDGHENLFVLMPIAPDLDDSEDVRSQYLDMIIDRIESHTGESIRSNIEYKRSFCVSDFKSEYNSFKGNAYGLANTLMQTANLKPTMKAKLGNVYFCGQLTVPGPGIPPALISGKIAANQILKTP